MPQYTTNIKRLAALTFWLTLSTYTHAEEGFSYKGIKTGDSATEIAEKLPHYECKGTSCTYLAFSCAAKNTSSFSFTPTPRDAINRKEQSCTEGTSFGGASIFFGSIKLIDGNVSAITLSIDTPQLNDLAKTLTLKYGPPKKIDTTPVMTKAGVPYENWVQTWEDEKDIVEVYLRDSKIDEGSVYIINKAYATNRLQEKNEKILKNSSDF